MSDNHDMRAMSRQAQFVAARNIPPSRGLSRGRAVLIYDTSFPLAPLDSPSPSCDDIAMTNRLIDPNTFTRDDALLAIALYALALRDAPLTDDDRDDIALADRATDSTLDDLDCDLAAMLDHDALAIIDDDSYPPIMPAADFPMTDLPIMTDIATALFNLRP